VETRQQGHYADLSHQTFSAGRGLDGKYELGVIHPLGCFKASQHLLGGLHACPPVIVPLLLFQELAINSVKQFDVVELCHAAVRVIAEHLAGLIEDWRDCAKTQ